MMRSTTLLFLSSCVVFPCAAQRLAPARQESRVLAPGAFWRRDVPHYTKWLTAAGAAALTIMGAAQHQQSKREWDQLLAICRSASQACATGPDGRYIRSDAEQLYQLSRQYDRRANHLLLGAQATLLVTTALFIIDLHPGGPGNIPFPASQLQVGLAGGGGGAAVGMRVAF
jgi:hypothetical protein